MDGSPHVAMDVGAWTVPRASELSGSYFAAFLAAFFGLPFP